MALIPHFFHYIQFNLLVNKLKGRQVIFTITIAIILTIGWVKYVYVKTVRPIASVQPGFQFTIAGFNCTSFFSSRTLGIPDMNFLILTVRYFIARQCVAQREMRIHTVPCQKST